MKPPILLILLFICSIGSHPIDAQKRAEVGKCPAYLGGYRGYDFGQEEKSLVGFKSLDEISSTIRSRVEQQLRARVGDQFYAKIEFEEGIGTDFDSKSDLSAVDIKRIDGYNLHLKLVVKEKGLSGYSISIAANKAGEFLDELQLPNIAANPSKGDIIPCEKAMEIASENGFAPAKSFIEMNYDRVTDSFAWDISVTKSGSSLTFTHIWLNANSGKKIKIYEEHNAF